MYRDKLNRKSNLSSIVELFLMFLLLLVVIVVITMVSMTTREQSLQASDLTKAVICAENTAEVTKYTEDAEAAAAMLEKMDGISDVNLSGDTITAALDDFRIEVTLSPDEGTTGTYVDETINIYADDNTSIYQLHTGSYIDKEASDEP